jgi:hypothetical protein
VARNLQLHTQLQSFDRANVEAHLRPLQGCARDGARATRVVWKMEQRDVLMDPGRGVVMEMVK